MGLLILRFQNLHTSLTADDDLLGVQKFHARAVPRIGGLVIFVGALAGLCISALWEKQFFWFNALAILAATPIFITGLAEDITKKVSVRARMVAACISAMLGAYWFNSWLIDVQFMGLDHLLAFPFF